MRQPVAAANPRSKPHEYVMQCRVNHFLRPSRAKT